MSLAQHVALVDQLGEDLVGTPLRNADGGGGLPIAYQVLDEGIAVYASDGEQVGTVDHVVSAPSEDIFHGIVMSAGGGRRFVAADQVASLHEHGVDLRSRWTHILDMMSGANPRRRDWTEED